MGRLAIRYGRSPNYHIHVDSIENLVQPINGQKVITTAFAIGSPAHKESIIVMESHTTVRFATEMKTQFNRWLMFLKGLNGGNVPVLFRRIMFDCYSAYYTHFCEVLNNMPIEEYQKLHWKRLMLNTESLPAVNTIFSQCTKHVADDWMLKVKSIESLKGPKNRKKKELLLGVTYHAVQQLIDSETPQKALHIMNAFLFLVGTACWMLSPGVVNVITEQYIHFDRNGSVIYWSPPQLPPAQFMFVHDVEFDVYKSRVELFGSEVNISVHAEEGGEASGVFIFCGKVFTFSFDELIQQSHASSNIFINSFLWCTELMEYAKRHQFLKAVLYMKQCKDSTEIMSNQLIEGTFRNERNQPLGCVVKKPRLDLRLFGRIDQLQGQIGRFIECNKLQYTREYNAKADWGPVDQTSQIYVSTEERRISEQFLDFWNLMGKPSAKDCIRDYTEMQNSDSFLQKGPVLNVGNIYKMKHKQPLPTRNSWKKYVTHWLKVRVEELRDNSARNNTD